MTATLSRPADAGPADETVAELIAHILERYHEVHRRQFPQAIELARRVEAVHAGAADAPIGLADHLSMMADRLEGHQRKEERVLFPLLLSGDGERARAPIARMSAEHRDVDEELLRLAELTGGFTAPVGACRSWQTLVTLCRTIRDDLDAHMSLEEDALFAPFSG